ncbi:translocon-associated protein subunit alpha [Trypanosoma conorhini]|uniref:Translocon-associated protein subunit alpha n=1 Tax=Trypanosoma conorhini TaxID=83891 RepID=A0A422PD98_9TRYP|nr:translocon-associated protein subunit alpha [Trypanosoma conorhini]RNF15691.1 translocon-associated protein subunit alpha [Trypanosoma conorhini]
MRSLLPAVLLPLLFVFVLLCLTAAPAVRAAEGEGQAAETAAGTEDAASTSRADGGGDDDDDDDESVGDEAGRYPLASARVIFPDNPMKLQPTLPAGSKANALIAYRNSQLGHQHTVVLIAGYITPVNDYSQVIQNFSIVRHARVVQPSDTTSFQYSFTPDHLLEPTDYNLILGLYFHDNVTNNTYFATAFNDTVTVDESLETDPRTLLTYVTLLGLFGGAAYFLASKLGLVALLKAKRAAGASRRRVEVGTKGEGYDPDYISSEHHKYKEALLQRNSSSSPSKKKK